MERFPECTSAWRGMAEDDAWENITADGSVRKRVLRAAREDAETPVAGKELSVHYTGRLKDAPADAAPFDDSRDRGEPLKFVLGRLEVIRGWDEAFAKMRVGERAMIECASNYAYGALNSHGWVQNAARRRGRAPSSNSTKRHAPVRRRIVGLRGQKERALSDDERGKDHRSNCKQG